MWKENSNRLKWKNWHNTITVGEINTTVTSMKNPRQNFNNTAAVLNKTLDQKSDGFDRSVHKFHQIQQNGYSCMYMGLSQR